MHVVENIRVGEVEARVCKCEVLEITHEHVHIAVTRLDVDAHGESSERLEGAHLAAEPGTQAQHGPTLKGPYASDSLLG